MVTMDFMNRGLARGQNITLSREIPDLRSVVVSIAWDAHSAPMVGSVLSMAAVLVGANSKASSDRDLVYFNQVISSDASTEHVKGAGKIKEQVEVDLDRVPAEVAKIVFMLYSDAGAGATRGLRRLDSCRMTISDLDTGASITSTVDLAPEMGDETVMLLGEMYRHQGAWKFRCIGQGYAAGLVAALNAYGVAL